MKNLKKLTALALCSLLVVSCAEQAAPKTTSAGKNYPTITISKSDSQVSQRYASSIRSTDYVDVMPQISGVITSVKVKEGSTVKKGETLFIIDQVPYKAALEVAKANVNSAKASVATAQQTADSSEELFKAKVISQNELQTNLNSLAAAKAALAQAQANQTIAENNLSYTEVSSPISGTAGMVPYKVGALVSSSISEPLITITNNSKMQVYFSISQNNMISMARQAGSKDNIIKNFPAVSLMLNDQTTYEHEGKIDAISGNIDQSTGTVSIRAAFDNPEGLLMDGASGNIIITSTYKDVIVIPQVATFQLQNKVLVYKVIDNKAHSAIIQVTENTNGTEYIVTDGLEVDEVIVASGAGLIREGMQVTGFTNEKPAEKK